MSENSDLPGPSQQMRLTLWDWLIGGLALAGLVPMLVPQAMMLWNSPAMWFVPLVVVLVVFLSVSNLRQAETQSFRRRAAAISVLVAGTIVYGFSVWNYSPALAQISLTITFFSWACGRWGESSWTHCAAVSAMLATTQIWPFNWDDRFTVWLEATAGRIASWTMDAFSIPNLLEPGLLRTETIDIALGDIAVRGGVFLAIALAVCLSVILHRSLFHAILLILSCPGWIVLSVFGAIFYAFYSTSQVDSSEGELLMVQTLIGAGVVLCVLATDQLLVRALSPVAMTELELGFVFFVTNNAITWPQPLAIASEDAMEEEYEDFYDDEAPPPAVIENDNAVEILREPFVWQDKNAYKFLVFGCVSVIVLLGIAPAIVLQRKGLSLRPAPSQIDDQLLDALPDEQTLPQTLGSWRQVQYTESLADDRSDVVCTWNYAWRGQVIVASLSYPNRGWPTYSERKRGWQPENEVVIRGQETKDWPILVSQLVNPLGGRIIAHSSAMTESFDTIRTPNGKGRQTVTEQPRARIVEMLDTTAPPSRENSFLITIECETGALLSERELQEFTAGFVAFRGLLTNAIETSKGGLRSDESPAAGPAESTDASADQDGGTNGY